METHVKIEKAENCETGIKYRNLIGALLYISSGTLEIFVLNERFRFKL